MEGDWVDQIGRPDPAGRDHTPAGRSAAASAKMGPMGELILLRHGQTEWSGTGRHTGRTDIPLTPEGEAAAKSLAPALASLHLRAAFTSPAHRAQETAKLAGLNGTDPDLWEWDYGGYEGLTTAQIQQQHPGWYLWHDGVVPGDPGLPRRDRRARGRAVRPGDQPDPAAGRPEA